MVGRYNLPMSSSRRHWLAVALWVLVIYTTIPFVRVLREWYVARWDPVWIGWLVAGVIVGAAVATLALLNRQTGEVPRRTTVWIIGATVIFVLWTFSLRRSPEETVHFLEYGVLAILLHRALLPTMPNALVFVAAALIGALVGTVDEVIQWISPSRYWDWRDLMLNGGAGALIQLVLWRIAAPADHPPDSASLRMVLRLVAAQLLLLVICLANTPARVARYAPHLPERLHLTSSRNPMAEYGHLHAEPGLGTFASRLTLEELRYEDEGRAAEVAGLVDAYRHRYGKFLDTWPVSDDPFTYEVRVHLFARDRNLAKAREQDFTGVVALEQLTVAWYENRLMEEFLGNTLEQSSYPWNPQLRERIDALQVTDTDFRSAAGSHLITIASERTLRLVLLMLVAAIIVADLRMGRQG